MRIALYSALTFLNAATAVAQETEHKPGGLMDIGQNVMLYVIIIFLKTLKRREELRLV